MAFGYNLADEPGITKLNLSAGGLTEEDDSVLVIADSDKAKGLGNKDIYLRYSKERDFADDPPEAFFADKSTFNSMLSLPESQFAKDGWAFKTFGDPDGNKTRKKYYVNIENTNTHEQYVGIPVPENHFQLGVDPNVDRLLIVDRRSFEDNPNLGMSLNHQRVKVKDVDGNWAVAENDLLAGRIKLSGNTIDANNPEEIYLLTEKELAQYNSKGGRKGWSEEKIDEPGLRRFVKRENKNGTPERVESRCAKEIMIPQEVDGKVTPVKHYLLSDKNTLESVEIMEPMSKKEKVVAPEVAEDTEAQPTLTAEDVAKMTEAPAFSAKNDATLEMDRVEPIEEEQSEEAPEGLFDAVTQAEAEDLSKSVNPGESGKPKVELAGLALVLASNIANRGNGSLSATEKAFLDELNEIQEDPEKLEALLATVENSPLHKNIVSLYTEMKKAHDGQGQDQNTAVNKGNPDVPSKGSTSVGGAEAAFGAAAGLSKGLVQGAFGAVQSVAGGAMTAVSKIIENHHKRQQYRLENPDFIEKEKAASKERLMVARRARAEDSNSMLDAKIESVLGSKQFIDEHPAVQQMYNMIEDDPSLKGELKGWLENAAKENPVFAEHLKNVKKNAGGVARGMEGNLQLNSLADGDIEKRKGKYEKFNKSFSDDPLADVLPDTGVEVPDGEQAATIKESITKAINNIMKMLKDMMLRLTGKIKEGQDQSAGQIEGSATAMLR